MRLLLFFVCALISLWMCCLWLFALVSLCVDVDAKERPSITMFYCMFTLISEWLFWRFAYGSCTFSLRDRDLLYRLCWVSHAHTYSLPEIHLHYQRGSVSSILHGGIGAYLLMSVTPHFCILLLLKGGVPVPWGHVSFFPPSFPLTQTKEALFEQKIG